MTAFSLSVIRWFSTGFGIVTVVVIGTFEFRSFLPPTKQKLPARVETTVGDDVFDTGGTAMDEDGDDPSTAVKTTSRITRAATPHIDTPEARLAAILSKREDRLAAWTVDHADEWDELDLAMQDCATECFIRGFSWTPEDAISTCLSQFELLDESE